MDSLFSSFFGEKEAQQQEQQEPEQEEQQQPEGDASENETTVSTEAQSRSQPKPEQDDSQDKPASQDFVKGFFSRVQTFGGKLRQGVSKVADQALGDFNRQQQAFVHEKRKKKAGAGLAPWVGATNSEQLKSQILALSSDERNFVRDPPPGAQHFQFNFEADYPTAMAILQDDERLSEMRFKLVPKKVTEEQFWRNYFYRVRLIQQSSGLAALSESASPEKAEQIRTEEQGSPKHASAVDADDSLVDETHGSEDATASYEAEDYSENEDEVEDDDVELDQLGEVSPEQPAQPTKTSQDKSEELVAASTEKISEPASAAEDDADSADNDDLDLQEELDNLDLQEMGGEGNTDDIEAELAELLADEQ